VFHLSCPPCPPWPPGPVCPRPCLRAAQPLCNPPGDPRESARNRRPFPLARLRCSPARSNLSTDAQIQARDSRIRRARETTRWHLQAHDSCPARTSRVRVGEWDGLGERRCGMGFGWGIGKGKPDG
jgi:hypothetical protein